MPIARKPLLFLVPLLAMAALAPMASAAPTRGITIFQEDNASRHCPIVRNFKGGCETHLTGEESFVRHVFGIEVTVSDCRVNLELRFDEDGEGYVHGGHYIGDAAHGCTRPICDLPWTIGSAGHDPRNAGEFWMRFEICRQSPSGAPSRCEVKVPIVDGGTHEYEVRLDPTVSGVSDDGAPCELRDGTLRTETGDPDFDPPLDPRHEVEIVH